MNAMELYEEILLEKLQLTLDPALIKKIVHDELYQALLKIKKIVENDLLDNRECFMRIEQIVCTLEALGSGGGTRHDFG